MAGGGDYKAFALQLLNDLMPLYYGRLWQALESKQADLSDFTGFLLNPERIVIHMGRTHVGLEYYGKERVDSIKGSDWNAKVEVLDYSLSDEDFFDRVIGFSIDDGVLKLPIAGPPVENLIIASNAGFDELQALGWNFAAEGMNFAINTKGFYVPAGKFGRLINARFFSKDAHGLLTRHIKWIDFIPLDYDDSGEEVDVFRIHIGPYEKIWQLDLRYVYPLPPKKDYRYSKLPQINRFVELIGTTKHKEPNITNFLADPINKFILLMKFGATEFFSQLECEWQGDERPSIKPDFFVLQPNGYADIVEFKLPTLKNSVIVGRENREAFSAELASCVAQTRVYRQYFDDSSNRRWFEEKYGFKVYKPKRIIVIGRRFDFTADEWRGIVDDYHDVQIVTYDDLVDGVTAQLYL
ncbi:Shedu anti-phage system protein SduA domain-containing protein [Ferrovibrio sp.]|uniref:Shedu anti-phage system protein SduA domain-containing protein n=1 Tax=Ferrovibrio sp. TaxID=1917215 RepID=UPI0035B1113A